MTCASATASKAATARGASSRAGLMPVALALALGLALVLALGACSGAGSGGDKSERTVLVTRRGENSIQVTESEETGNQLVRVKTVIQGQENTIVLDIDQAVYEVEIPLSLEQSIPGSAAAAAQAKGPEGQFQDIFIAQTLQKAQQAMASGDYNAALQQVDTVLQVQPNHLQAHSMKGSVYYALGNYELANEEWEFVLSLDPSNKEVLDFKDFLKNRQTNAAPKPPGGAQGTTPGRAPGRTPGAATGGATGGAGATPPPPPPAQSKAPAAGSGAGGTQQ